MLTVVVK